MKVIGLHGKKRRGKDTVAAMLGDLLGGDYKLISPADNLKMLLCESLGIPYDDLPRQAVQIMDDCKENWTLHVTTPSVDGDGFPRLQQVAHISGRQFQQFTGDGARKVFGADFWIDQVLPPSSFYNSEDQARLARKHNMQPDATLMIPSVRYENEAQRTREYGGPVIEVVRPGLPDNDSFVSEQRLPDHLIDYTIINDGTLDELREKVALCADLLGLV